MNCWEQLGIPPTPNADAVKKAFSDQSKLHHPEDDPEGFRLLREAYRQALRLASNRSLYTLPPVQGNDAPDMPPQLGQGDTAQTEQTGPQTEPLKFDAPEYQQPPPESGRPDKETTTRETPVRFNTPAFRQGDTAQTEQTGPQTEPLKFDAPEYQQPPPDSGRPDKETTTRETPVCFNTPVFRQGDTAQTEQTGTRTEPLKFDAPEYQQPPPESGRPDKETTTRDTPLRFDTPAFQKAFQSEETKGEERPPNAENKTAAEKNVWAPRTGSSPDPEKTPPNVLSWRVRLLRKIVAKLVEAQKTPVRDLSCFHTPETMSPKIKYVVLSKLFRNTRAFDVLIPLILAFVALLMIMRYGAAAGNSDTPQSQFYAAASYSYSPPQISFPAEPKPSPDTSIPAKLKPSPDTSIPADPKPTSDTSIPDDFDPPSDSIASEEQVLQIRAQALNLLENDINDRQTAFEQIKSNLPYRQCEAAQRLQITESDYNYLIFLYKTSGDEPLMRGLDAWKLNEADFIKKQIVPILKQAIVKEQLTPQVWELCTMIDNSNSDFQELFMRYAGSDQDRDNPDSLLAGYLYLKQPLQWYSAGK